MMLSDYRAIKSLYHYRGEPGGTDGVEGTWATKASIQAPSKTLDSKISWRLISINGNLIRVYKASPEIDRFWFVLDAEVTADWAGQYTMELFESGAVANILLDNYSDDPQLSRFTVQGEVRRNPVDVALMIMTTCNSEFDRRDASGGTSSVLAFSGSPGWSTDGWAGAWLHCVEGVNKGTSREITANTSAGITVSPAFANAPAAGDEYQIRNSEYDVLPVTWGMGIRWDDIDIDSFEDVRSKYLNDVELGRFALGAEDRINLWQLLVEHIFKPYGMLVYRNRTTHKITCAYVGDALGDGIDDDYLPIVKSQILSVSDIDYQLAKPVGAIDLEVRESKETLVRLAQAFGGSLNRAFEKTAIVADSSPISGKKQKIEIIPEDLSYAYDVGDLRRVTVSAMLNTTVDCGPVAGLCLARIRRNMVPRPIVRVVVDIALYPSIRDGVLVSLTYADAPIDPFKTTRGWSQVIGRVIGYSLPLMESLGVELTLELLDELNSAQIAPAAYVTGKGSDGFGEYVTVSDNRIIPEATGLKDWYQFEMGHLIHLRAGATGTALDTLGSLGEITAFGSNQSATPQGASDSRVYVSGSVPGITFTDKSIALDPWDSAQPASMDKFAAMADNTTELLDATDVAKWFT
jgi:hypothetical protein